MKKDRARRPEFLLSAADISQAPNDDVPEIAFLGRSNAGKSSLLNSWLGADLAKVSSQPGKTRLLNFFSFNQYRLVDLPGYGYAAISDTDRRAWRQMVEEFLRSRRNLVGCILIVDVRRDWSEQEGELVEWLNRRGLPTAVAINKIDKLGRADLSRAAKSLRADSQVRQVFLTSAAKNQGVAELEEHCFREWVVPRQQQGTSAGDEP